jgi:glycosyltransferase involved in cell wall biosynthesis
MGIKISYAITVCNEIEEIKRLIPFLLKHKRLKDEIVVLMDDKGSDEVWEYLLSIEDRLGVINRLKFNNNFSEWKNKLNLLCSGDYIFNIDADEIPSETLINYLPQIIEDNSNIKAYAVPRVNTVEGLTQEHIQKWRWRVDDKNRINYPDPQVRIFKNIPEIYWEGKVHETLNIKNEVVPLPMESEDWVLYHPKTIERQEKQNNYYNTL